jgi:3-oxoacyl-[acyl-carrier-protein] synthase II
MLSRSSNRSADADTRSGEAERVVQAPPADVAVTAWGIHVPGFDPSELIDGYTDGPGCAAERAHELLGRKGLLYKEPATLLAFCAVHRALGLLRGGALAAGAPDPATAVVVSSNLGNVATVHKIVRLLQNGALRDVSAMDAPNASSNVTASAISIRFRFGGPSLMVCSGANSGLDAVALGCLLLRAGRASRVVVAGTEPDDETATRLHRERTAARRGYDAVLRAAAACIVLEPAASASFDAPMLGRVRHEAQIPTQDSPVAAKILLGRRHAGFRGDRILDLTARLGDTYGALGVFQVAVASAMMARSSAEALPSAMVRTGDPVEGWSSLLIERNLKSLPILNEADDHKIPEQTLA